MVRRVGSGAFSMAFFLGAARVNDTYAVRDGWVEMITS